MQYNDPSGHDACLANNSGSWNCNKNPGIGGQTQTLDISPMQINGTTFGPDVPNYPTAYAIQVGGQAGLGLVAEAGVSGEVSVVVNVYSGEVSVFTTEGSTIQLSTPHVAYASVYGGVTAITGASQNSILEGPSLNGGGQIGLDLFANAGVNASSGYAVQFDDKNGNQQHDVNLVTDYTESMKPAPALDPKFGTPVRTYSVNLSTGANIFPNGIDGG